MTLFGKTGEKMFKKRTKDLLHAEDNKTNCPVCSANKWQNTGVRIQKIADNHWKQGYPKIQKYVFFNIWHHNKQEVEMKRCVCQKCGFVLDFPRPDEKDIAKKYKYLTKVEKYLGSAKDISKKAITAI